MAHTINKFTFNGTQTDYDLSFTGGYRVRSDVTAYKEGVVNTPISFNWLTPARVRVTTTGLLQGDTIVFQRTVSKENPPVDIMQPNNFTREAVVAAVQHALQAMQEVLDGRVDSFNGGFINQINGYIAQAQSLLDEVVSSTADANLSQQQAAASAVAANVDRLLAQEASTTSVLSRNDAVEAADRAEDLVGGAILTGPSLHFNSYAQALAAVIPNGVNYITATVLDTVIRWRRQEGGPCLGGGWVPVGDAEPGHFGTITGVNDTVVLQAWLSFGGRLLLTGNCGFGGPLTASVSGTKIISGGGRMVWTGTYYALDGLTLTGYGISMHGVEIDGADLLGKGVLVTGAGCAVAGNHIHNMRSTTGTSTGIHATSRTGGRIANNHVHHIHSVGNTTTGDANGAARAVLVQGTEDLLAPYDIDDNDIHDITGEEGDGIQILLLGGTTFRSALKTRITRNRVKGCSKRCIKVQANEVIVSENPVLLDMAGAYSAMDIINSSRCAILDNDIEVTAADGRGVQYNSFDVPTFGRCADSEVRRNRVKMPAGSAHIGIYIFLVDRPVTSGNRITGGRIIIDNCVSSVTNDNSGKDVELSSSDGLVSIRNNCTGATVNGNTLFSGSAYTCVRVDSAGTFVSGNRNHSLVSNAASVVFLTAGGCVITNNINAKPAVPVIRYNTGITEAMQTLVANNILVA